MYLHSQTHRHAPNPACMGSARGCAYLDLLSPDHEGASRGSRRRRPRLQLGGPSERGALVKGLHGRSHSRCAGTRRWLLTEAIAPKLILRRPWIAGFWPRVWLDLSNPSSSVFQDLRDRNATCPHTSFRLRASSERNNMTLAISLSSQDKRHMKAAKRLWWGPRACQESLLGRLPFFGLAACTSAAACLSSPADWPDSEFMACPAGTTPFGLWHSNLAHMNSSSSCRHAHLGMTAQWRVSMLQIALPKYVNVGTERLRLTSTSAISNPIHVGWYLHTSCRHLYRSLAD